MIIHVREIGATGTLDAIMPVIDEESHTDGVNSWNFSRGSVSAPLSGLVVGYHAYSERTPGFTTRREVPHAEGVLIVNLGKSTLVTAGDGKSIALRPGDGFIAGVHLRPALSYSDGEQEGVQIELPLATLRRLTRTPMNTIVDQVVPLDAIFGHRAQSLGWALGEASSAEQRFARFDRWLVDLVAETKPLSQQSLYALKLLRSSPQFDITRIASEVGWSRKHLANRIEDLVGIGPRSYRRLLRFGRAVSAAGKFDKPNWADIAATSGYADQPHLTREFREFSGLTPTAYRARLLSEGGGLIES
jgi:AraC-like DNA-binding protein